MNKIAILYGSTTGNTKAIAMKISSLLNADIYDVAEKPIDALAKYNNLILGVSTWGLGDLQDDWESFLPHFESADLNGKTVAIFGLGDAEAYPDTFVDGMGTLFNASMVKGCKVVGFTPTDEFKFDESTAVVEKKFVGLPIDEDNESYLTDKRIQNWVEQLRKEFS
ncbi:MAG TPA: flavodoxin [Bacteroidales bacterium]|nr:flavodoxin [Bacteroidales bacterium]